jgi:hypothetical protein
MFKRHPDKQKPSRMTEVPHAGKTVKGWLLPEFQMGAIEVYATSSTAAVRTDVAATANGSDSEEEEHAAHVFQSLRDKARLGGVGAPVPRD